MNTTVKTNLVLTLFILWISHFLIDFMIGVWPVYKTIAHLDIAKAGMIAGLCAFIGEGMQMLFGSLSDSGYRRSLIMLGLAGTMACAFLAYTQDYLLLFLLFMVTSIGSGAFHPAAIGWAGSLSEKRKGLFIAIFSSGGALGIGASQLIFSNFYHSFDGQTVYLAIPTLFVIFLVFFKMVGAEAPPQSKKIDLKGFFQLFKNRNIALLYFIQVCNQSIVWGFIFLLPEILLSFGYEKWVCFGGGHLCFILGGALMMVPSGYLADKYSFRTVLLTASGCGMTLFYFFLFNPPGSAMTLTVLLFLMGCAVQVINPIILAFGNRLMPSKAGTVSAFLMGLALCISEGIGMGGGGLLTKYLESPAKAAAVLGMFFIVGMSLTSLLPKTIVAEEKIQAA